MAYGWIITKDHIDNNEAKGVAGPRTISKATEIALNAGEGTKFKMSDDDGECFNEDVYKCWAYGEAACWHRTIACNSEEGLVLLWLVILQTTNVSF